MVFEGDCNVCVITYFWIKLYKEKNYSNSTMKQRKVYCKEILLEMNVLQYQWSNSCPDLEEVLKSMRNVKVYTENKKIIDYDKDVQFMEYWEYLIKKNDINICISFDYFPIISKVCEEKSIVYISWIYDSPHTTLYSKTLFNSSNYIFSFDKVQVNEFRARGVSQIYHQPLAVNSNRLEKIFGNVGFGGKKSYAELSFVGSLYQDNLYEQISYLPPHLKGYIDGICRAQSVLYGGSIVEELLHSDTISELKKYVALSMSSEYEIDYKILFCDNILKKYISSLERKEVLEELSDYFKVALYSNQKLDVAGIDFRGIVDYRTKAPMVFRKSALNLNLSIRSITSGIPLRCLDVMGSGGVLLSNYQPELAEYFIPEEEWICFSEREELIEKVMFYLEHDDLRAEIAKKGYEKIKNRFTYEHAIENIFKKVGI